MIEKDFSRELFEEAERIDREEVAATDEELEGRWIFVRPRPPKEPSQTYSIRLPVSVVEQLRLIAAARGEAPTALLRDWALERLDRELKEEREPSPGARPKRSGGTGREAMTRRRAAGGGPAGRAGPPPRTRTAAKGNRSRGG